MWKGKFSVVYGTLSHQMALNSYFKDCTIGFWVYERDSDTLQHNNWLLYWECCDITFITFSAFIKDWCLWLLTTSASTSDLTRSPISAEMSEPNCCSVVRNLFSFASCLAPQVGGNCRLILLVVLISASGLRIASGEGRPRGGKPTKL